MWSAYANRAIYLDSNIVIYAIEGTSRRLLNASQTMVDAIDRRIFRAVTSELTIAEVLSKPLALSDDDQVSKYERFFAPNSALLMPPVNRDTLLAAARLRGQSSLKLFDAIHVAASRLSGCDYFLTQDERLGRAIADQPKWLKLSEIM